MLREMFCALESPTRSPSLSFPGIACATSRERLSPGPQPKKDTTTGAPKTTYLSATLG